MSEERGGAALVLVLLVLLGAFGLGHALLVSAQWQSSSVRAGVQVLVAESASRSVLREHLRGPTRGLDSVPPWGIAPARIDSTTGLPVRVELRRLGAETWLASARGTTPPRVEVRRLVRIFDPVVRLSRLRGVVTVSSGATVVIGGSIDPSSVGLVPAGLVAACPPVASGDFRLVPDSVRAVHRAASPRPAADALGAETLATLIGLGRSVDSLLTPTPVERLGRCDESSATNWGDPTARSSPCFAYLPFLSRVGDVRIDGGVGQGLLVVDGDVTLGGDARYEGWVVASGRVLLEDRARVRGFVVAEAGIESGPSSALEASYCAGWRALDANYDRLGIPRPFTEPLGPS